MNRLLDRLHVFILKIAAALALLMLVIDAMGLPAHGSGVDSKRVTAVSQSISPFTGTITFPFYLPMVRQPRPPLPPTLLPPTIFTNTESVGFPTAAAVSTTLTMPPFLWG